MQVNTTRWGTPDTWVDYNANAEIKRPSNAKNSYDMAYGLNTSTPDESMHTDIDLSIAPWGINKNSLLNKRYYVAPWIDDATQYPCDLIPINEDELEKSKPFIINGRERIYNASGGSFSANSIVAGNATLVNNYNPNFPEYNSVSTITNWAFNNIIVNFNYHKIVLCPFIVCSPGTSVNDTNIFNYSTWDRYTFDEFIANYNSQIKGKKVVRGLLWFEYLGNNGARSANNSEYSMQFTIPYKVPKRPDIAGMSYNDRRYPKVDIETMLSTGAQNINQYARACMGSFTSTRVDWLRWWDVASTPDRSINRWSGASSSNINQERRTIVYDDSIFEWYFQPFVSGQNRNGAAIIMTENRTAQEIVEYFARQMAYLGFMFAWNETDAQSAIIGENNSICIPTFDGGVTTGNYTRGTENVNNPAFLWRDDVYEKNNYNPSEANSEDDKGKLNNYTFHSFAARGSNKFYALDSTDVKNFIDFVNTLYVNDPDNKQLTLDFKGSNPNNYIVGLYKYPWNLVVLPTTTIKLGVLDTSINAYEADAGNGYFTCGEVYINKEFNNFRDYAPYTILELFIPYCGTVELDTAFFVGHSVGIDIVYDLNTAAMTAIVYRNDGNNKTIYKTVEGTAAASVPLSSVETGNYQNTITRLKLQKRDTVIRGATTGLQAVVSAMTGGAGINDVISAAQSGYDYGSKIRDINYELSHIQPSIADTSTASPSNGFTMSDTPILFIKRLKTLEGYDPATYSHTVGNACCINAERLGDFSGLVKCSNVDLTGIPATADEINAIKSALQDGVYL